MSLRNSCANKVNKFCNVCGCYEVKKYRNDITKYLKQSYFKCYGFSIQNLDKPWVPNMICNNYATSLKLQNKNNKGVPHVIISNDEITNIDDITNNDDEILFSEEINSEKSNMAPKPLNQKELNDLVRDCNLSKQMSELLASRLKERNLVTAETKITFYRNREQNFLKYFSEEDSIVYCSNIRGLINEIKSDIYIPEEWRLFIDSSKRSLKAILLHNGNKYASVPIAHSVKIQENYNSFKKVLQKIKYSEHQWLICSDVKVLCMILGQQSGNTKFPCYLCEWDSRKTFTLDQKRMASKN
ncbi:hypothetical protein ALC57_18384 [Trachymyrmex cornetzi]|uniref:Uncharacterized protein n=1 Tax=Trachymyrmex cornetzi TaxID=471704 RepID=A0A151IS38_9HYME|nr:hypothetical protein ALC57_18384 [Trachymyrmex cornetzi]